jgi:hypothetical protein
MFQFARVDGPRIPRPIERISDVTVAIRSRRDRIRRRMSPMSRRSVDAGGLRNGSSNGGVLVCRKPVGCRLVTDLGLGLSTVVLVHPSSTTVVTPCQLRRWTRGRAHHVRGRGSTGERLPWLLALRTKNGWLTSSRTIRCCLAGSFDNLGVRFQVGLKRIVARGGVGKRPWRWQPQLIGFSPSGDRFAQQLLILWLWCPVFIVAVEVDTAVAVVPMVVHSDYARTQCQSTVGGQCPIASKRAMESTNIQMNFCTRFCVRFVVFFCFFCFLVSYFEGNDGVRKYLEGPGG